MHGITRRAAAAAIFLVCLTAAMAGRPVGADARRVLIISVDGLRPDLLLRADPPNIRALMARGAFTMRARTIAEGYTVPSHVSMLTGVTPSRHGVTWDGHIEDAYPNEPTLFELAKRAGYTTAVVTAKTKLIVLTKPGTVDWSFLANESFEHDDDVVRHATDILRSHRPEVMFVHLGGVDVAGHAKGWASDEQMAAIADADRAIGTILDTVKAIGLLDSTVVIVTADHGGRGLQHDPDDPSSQLIPWIAAGPSVRANYDLALLPDLAVDTMGTFATACEILGITLARPVDGRSMLSAITTASSP
jgi:arylsulfatase A-like enzyme